MSVWFWIAAAWLATAAVITLAFFGAKRSHQIYVLLFGEVPAADVLRLAVPQGCPAPEQITRLAA